MSEDPPAFESLAERVGRNAPDRSRILLATSRKWLESALAEVLTPDGFQVVHARDPEQLLRRAEEKRPAVVIVDEKLPGLEAEDAARSLIEGPLDERTPLLLYTSGSLSRGRAHAGAYRAGFWDLLSEPLRPSVLVAKLRRLLALSRQMEARPSAATDRPTRSIAFLSLDELGRMLPTVRALAEREEASVSVVLLAPTSLKYEDPERQREATASFFGPNLRRADLCAWVNEAEVAVVAYDTNADEAQVLVERLNELAAERPELEDAAVKLSAAIVEIEPSRDLARAVRDVGRPADEGALSLDEVVRQFHIGEAKTALRDVREAGGGIRIVDTD